MSDIKHKVEQVRLHLVNRKDVYLYTTGSSATGSGTTLPRCGAEPLYFGPIVGIPSPTGPPEAWVVPAPQDSACERSQASPARVRRS